MPGTRQVICYSKSGVDNKSAEGLRTWNGLAFDASEKGAQRTEKERWKMRGTHTARTGIVLAALVVSLSIGSRTARGEFAFGAPAKIPNVSMPQAGAPQISRDGLELYFVCEGENACQDLWVARRSSLTSPWSASVRLDPPVNSDGPVGGPCISSDGLELYFSDGMPVQYEGSGCVPNSAGYGGGDIWVSRRAARDDAWGDPVNLGPPVNTSSYEDHPCLTSNGLSLYFTSNRSGSYTLWVTTRPAIDADWGQPERLGAIDMIMYETTPFISPDGLSLYFSMGGWTPDIYVSRRTSVSKSWGQPTLFTPVNSAGAEYHLSFAEGDSRVYFTRGDNFETGFDLWQVEVTPLADLNGDDVVDSEDIAILLEHWGQKSSYDIGPSPLGDGLIDDADLEVLYRYVDGDLAVVPTPALNETGVAPFADLNWTRGALAQTYDVYFGTSFDDVLDASRADPRGVLVSQGQSINTYDPEGTLELGQTYYWRIDEVNTLSDPVIVSGVAWNFTTQSSLGSEAAPIRVLATTASSSQEGMEPEHTIDRSGLNEGDSHSTTDVAMWLSAADGPQPTWIQYQFDGVYPLKAMWIWNYNGLFEQFLGNGLKDVTIQYSEDGANWTTWGDAEFAQGTSRNDYTYNTTVDFDGVPARYVRLTVQSNWGGVAPQSGLSEVRFFYIPPEGGPTETMD